MLVFFVTSGEDHTLTDFFDTWARRLRERVILVHYEDLAERDTIPGASAYFFTDIERLTPTGVRLTAQLADALSATVPAPRILNHPRSVLRRYEFLRMLHRRGFNAHQARRAKPLPWNMRFPVFVRCEYEHRVISPLLSTRTELRRALRTSDISNYRRDSLLIVEFEDARDKEGLYHQHTAYVFGERILAGVHSSGPDWIAKLGSPAGSNHAPEEEDVARVFYEQRSTLLTIARLAGIEYGRFDYAVVDGRLCVWELNTNPTILMREDKYDCETRQSRVPLAEVLITAFESMISETDAALPDVHFELRRSDEPLVGVGQHGRTRSLAPNWLSLRARSQRQRHERLP